MSLVAPLDAADHATWLRLLLSKTIDTAIILLTIDGEILGWLGAAEPLFGYTSSEAVGLNVRVIFTPEDVEGQLDRQERELALSGGRSEDDRWHVRKDGSRFWGSGVMERVVDDRGRVVGLAKILRDRTDVRTMTVALQNRLRNAEQQNHDRIKGVASLAHELRNQVTPLANLLAAVEKSHGAGRATGAMQRQIQLMARLLDDLAEGAAVAAAPTRIVVARVEVQQVLRHAADSMSALVQGRGQTLTLTVPETPILIDADAHRLDQVLVNLLSNASKFTPAGGRIQLSATVEDDMAVVRVEDDGVGIPAEVLPRIFELFSREERVAAPDGLGVGLSVVKQLIELHGGFVEGRSPGRGGGSIFTVRLPLHQRSPDAREP